MHVFEMKDDYAIRKQIKTCNYHTYKINKPVCYVYTFTRFVVYY